MLLISDESISGFLPKTLIFPKTIPTIRNKIKKIRGNKNFIL
jgi:hypothetical protein